MTTMDELQSVREKLQDTMARLAEAETALLFYADPKNYEATRILDGRTLFRDRLKGDYSIADNSQNTNIAGSRAREYFKRYENE